MTDVVQQAAVKVAESTEPVAYDLGCGQRPREGYVGVDVHGGDAKIKLDLFKFPWPWKDSSVDKLHSSHFLEHIPAREVEPRDLADATRIDLIGKDALCAFVDEAWRVLKPGGEFSVIVPCARSNRAFMDPTHRRFFVAESFLYFNREWRRSQGLDHGYLCGCNFGVEVNHAMLTDLSAMHPEAQARRFSESWNVVFDWHVRMVAVK